YFRVFPIPKIPAKILNNPLLSFPNKKLRTPEIDHSSGICHRSDNTLPRALSTSISLFCSGSNLSGLPASHNHCLKYSHENQNQFNPDRITIAIYILLFSNSCPQATSCKPH